MIAPADASVGLAHDEEPLRAEGAEGAATQWICRSMPFCLCVGPNEWNQCSCGPDNFVSAGENPCQGCGARRVLVDFETGEEVLRA